MESSVFFVASHSCILVNTQKQCSGIKSSCCFFGLFVCFWGIHWQARNTWLANSNLHNMGPLKWPTETHHVHLYTDQLSGNEVSWQNTRKGVRGGWRGAICQMPLQHWTSTTHSDTTVHRSGYGLIWRQRQRNTPHMNKHWPNKEHRVF